MARLTIEQVKEELKGVGLKYIGGEYTNLKSLLDVECPKGHAFLISLHKARTKADCPTCYQYDNMDAIESKIERPSEKKGVRVMAVDNATNTTGFAIFEDGNYIHGGIKKTTKNQSVQKIAEMKQWFISMIELWEIDVVGLEGVQYQGNAQTLIILSKLLGVLENTSYEILRTEPYIVPAVTWKSHSGVKGKNRAQQKENAQRTVQARYGLKVSSDLADAMLLGRYVCYQERFGQTTSW